MKLGSLVFLVLCVWGQTSYASNPFERVEGTGLKKSRSDEGNAVVTRASDTQKAQDDLKEARENFLKHLSSGETTVSLKDVERLKLEMSDEGLMTLMHQDSRYAYLGLSLIHEKIWPASKFLSHHNDVVVRINQRANKGSALDLHTLGLIYLWGIGNSETCLDNICSLCKDGKVTMVKGKSVCGRMIQRNHNFAVEQLTRAAEDDCILSMWKLAQMYETGFAVEHSLIDSLKWQANALQAKLQQQNDKAGEINPGLVETLKTQLIQVQEQRNKLIEEKKHAERLELEEIMNFLPTTENIGSPRSLDEIAAAQGLFHMEMSE